MLNWNIWIIFLCSILRISIGNDEPIELVPNHEDGYDFPDRSFLYTSEVDSLEGHNWVRSRIIDFTVEKIISRGGQLIRNDVPIVYVRADTAIALLNGRDYLGPKSKLTNTSLKEKIIIYPISYKSIHWVLIIINTSDQTISYYDPIDPKNRNLRKDREAWNYINRLKEVLNERNTFVKEDEKLDVSQWKLIFKPHVKIEKMTEMGDCGIYVIRYIDLFINQTSPIFNQMNTRDCIKNFIWQKLNGV